MSKPPISIEAPLTVNAQIEARAQHPDTREKVLLMHGDRSWTYARYRYSAFGPAQTRDLVVRFGGGVVASYSFNSTHPEDSDL